MKTRLLVLACICGLAFTAHARKAHLDLEAEPTWDGLYPVKKTVMDNAWIHPDLDLRNYDKIILVGTGLHYRPVEPMEGTSSIEVRRRSVFPLDAKQKQRLQEAAQEQFEKEFVKLDRFEVTKEVGPGVLLLRGGIYDIVSMVPPEPIGRGDFYLSSLGSAVIALELIDAQSNTVIARAVDATSFDKRGFPESNTAANMAEARNYMRQWAKLVRKALDEVVAVDETGKVIRQK